MSSWLRKRLEEAQANLNVFDGGKSMATVRRARNPVPPAQTISKPSIIDRARSQVNFRDNGASWTNPNPAQRRIDQNNAVDARGKQLRQQLQAGQISREDFNREFGSAINQNSDQASQLDKRNLALANATERNRVLNPVLGSLAQWNPSNKVGDVGFAVGTTLRDRFGVKNGFNDALIASSADLTDQTDRLLKDGWSPTGGTADALIRGGVGMVDQIANAAVSPVASAGLIGAQSYGNQYRNTVEGGGTFDQANKSGLILGAGEAALEKVGLGRIMKGGGRLTTRLVTSALTEGATEASQTALENKVAQKTYDPNRSLSEGVAQSALVGGILGGAASGGMSAVNRYSGDSGKKQLQQDTQKAKQVAKSVTPDAVLDKRLSEDNVSYQAVQQSAQQKAEKINQLTRDGQKVPAYLKKGYEADLAEMQRIRNNHKGKGSLNPDYSATPDDGKTPLTNNTASGKGLGDTTSNASIKPLAVSQDNSSIAPEVQKEYEFFNSSKYFADNDNVVKTLLELGDDTTPTYKALDRIRQERGIDNVYAESIKIANKDKATSANKTAQATTDKKVLDGFTDGKSSLQAGKIQKTLDGQIRYKGNVMAKRDYIKGLINDGATIKDGKLTNPDGTTPIISKTEQDYAKHLIDSTLETINNNDRRVYETKPNNGTRGSVDSSRESVNKRLKTDRRTNKERDTPSQASPSAPQVGKTPDIRESRNTAQRAYKDAQALKAKYQGKPKAQSKLTDAEKKAVDKQYNDLVKTYQDYYKENGGFETGTGWLSIKDEKGVDLFKDTAGPKPFIPFSKIASGEASLESTSSNSSSTTSPELSASSPRNSGQEIGLQVQPRQKNQKVRVNNQASTQGLSYDNSTTKTRKVKLNTDRLNMDSGYKGMAELDRQTTEIIESLSNKDIERLSKDAGIDTKTYSPEQVKKKIAEQLNVRRDAVKYMNDAEIARKAGNFKLAEELMLKGAEKGRISRAQGSEIAQQLQARRIIANELDTPQQRIFKLLDAAGVNPEAYVNRLAKVDFSDAKQVVEAYRDLVPAKKAEWLDTLRYNSMLSSPLTQAVNIFGNAQGVMGVAPIEKTIRGTFDAIAGTFGKERQYAAGEGLAYSKGAVTNIRNATIEFRDALTGSGKYANPDFNDYNIPLATKGVSGAAYKGLSFPMRVLDGMDKFFRTMASAGEESALNLRENKGIKLGGNKEALMEQEASYRVFQQEFNKPGQGTMLDAFDSFAQLVMSGRNSKNPYVSTISKFTVPFVKTINNINKQGMVEYSPVGFLNMHGNTDKVTSLTRATMGTAVFGLSALLVAAGEMTWAEPRDPEERARFRSEGKQAYAVKIGGKWLNFSKLHPSISFPMAMTAAIDDAMKNKKIDQGNADAIMEAISKYGNFLADQSYAKTVGDTLGAIGGDKEAVARMVANNIQQVIPMRAFTGWFARMTDGVERKVDTTKGYIDQQVQSIMQQYPGLRQKTTTRDYKGEPIPANNPVFNAISPVRVTNDRGVSSSDQALDAIKEATDKDPLLNKKQIAEIDKLTKKQIADAQNAVLSDPSFQSLSNEDKKSRIAKISTDIKAVARRKYMVDNKVGEYADNFMGEEKKLTKDQTALLKNGELNMSKYTRASDTPSLPDNINPTARKIFESEDTDDKDWATKPTSENTVKQTLTSWLPQGVTPPPFTNGTAKKWAEYEKKKAEGTLGKLEDEAERKTILRSAYNSQLNEDERDLYKLSEKDLVDAYDRGLINDKNIENALAVEKRLYDAGLIDKETLARKLDRKARGYKAGKGSKGKKSSLDYTKLFALSGDTTASTKKLSDIVRAAKIT
jgi:hypothetical protein